MVSVLDQNSLDQFVELAAMAKREFAASRDIKVVTEQKYVVLNGDHTDLNILNNFLTEKNIRNPEYKALKIPRRPKWNKEQTSKEIND